jgi:hypothetical protein
MKYRNVVIPIIVLFFVHSASAQNIPGLSFLRSLFLNQNVYKTKADLEVERIYQRDTGEPLDDNNTYTILLGTRDFIRYRVVKEEDDYYYIRVLPRMEYSVPVITNSGMSVAIQATDNTPTPTANNPTNYYYRVTKEDLLPHHHYLASQKLMGMPITLPVKFRKENGNLRGEFDLSLGYAFGYRIRVNNNPYNDSYINLIPYGFSFNADEYKAEGSDEDAVDSFSLTYWASGIAYEYRKFNIGVFIGRDRMFNDRKDWIYQNETWYSIGLGFKFGDDD